MWDEIRVSGNLQKRLRLRMYRKKPLTVCICDNCSCNLSDKLLHMDFEVRRIVTPDEFMQCSLQEAVLFCVCHLTEEKLKSIIEAYHFPGPNMPILCTREYTLDTIIKACRCGIYDIVECRGESESMRARLNSYIDKKQFSLCLPEAAQTSGITGRFYYKALVNEIIGAYPSRLKEKEIASRLKISEKRLRKYFSELFGTNYKCLIRGFFVFQVLRYMYYTGYDNKQIALLLNYSEECNMARDLRKELRLTPTEVRLMLREQTPEEIFYSRVRF